MSDSVHVSTGTWIYTYSILNICINVIITISSCIHLFSQSAQCNQQIIQLIGTIIMIINQFDICEMFVLTLPISPWRKME